MTSTRRQTTKPPHLRDWGVCAPWRGPALAVCGDACIAVHHAPIMHLSFAQQKPKRINPCPFRAKVMIFAQEGQVDTASAKAHDQGRPQLKGFVTAL